MKNISNIHVVYVYICVPDFFGTVIVGFCPPIVFCLTALLQKKQHQRKQSFYKKLLTPLSQPYDMSLNVFFC